MKLEDVRWGFVTEGRVKKHFIMNRVTNVLLLYIAGNYDITGPYS